MKAIFQVKLSYQTVLNYAEATAVHCHDFNLQHKGKPAEVSCGDETYIKIKGKHHYAFFFVSNTKITAYHLADTRDTLPATAVMMEAARDGPENKTLTFVTDGNPSYQAGAHFMNMNDLGLPNIELKKVIGLTNQDEVSEEFRPYKQIIERLNRTYKAHVRPSAGYNTWNGAMAMMVLFVTHYNFLRPHMALQYQTPVQIPELEKIPTLQDKWIRLLDLAA